MMNYSKQKRLTNLILKKAFDSINSTLKLLNFGDEVFQDDR